MSFGIFSNMLCCLWASRAVFPFSYADNKSSAALDDAAEPEQMLISCVPTCVKGFTAISEIVEQTLSTHSLSFLCLVLERSFRGLSSSSQPAISPPSRSSPHNRASIAAIFLRRWGSGFVQSNLQPLLCPDSSSVPGLGLQQRLKSHTGSGAAR